jgi:hypothetical protein
VVTGTEQDAKGLEKLPRAKLLLPPQWGHSKAGKQERKYLEVKQWAS